VFAPITDADVAVVADFLHANFNPRVSSSTWSRVMSVPWKVDAPNDELMQLADRDDHLLSDDAITQIHEAARGKPRTVNNLAAALIATCAARKAIVDHAAARAAIADVITTD
jgi:hypothetical protein